MDSIDLIVGALLIGAGSGISESTQAAFSDTYLALRSRLIALFTHSSQNEALDRFEEDPAGGESDLRSAILDSTAIDDDALLVAARRVWDVSSSTDERYEINLANAKGVQIGDRNTQTNNF